VSKTKEASAKRKGPATRAASVKAVVKGVATKKAAATKSTAKKATVGASEPSKHAKSKTVAATSKSKTRGKASNNIATLAKPNKPAPGVAKKTPSAKKATQQAKHKILTGTKVTAKSDSKQVPARNGSKAKPKAAAKKTQKNTATKQAEKYDAMSKNDKLKAEQATAPVKPIGKPGRKKGAIPARAPLSEIVLPSDYRPSETEPFMNPMHQVYFRDKLMAWKEDIIRQTRQTLEGLNTASEQHADVADRATSETDRSLELRARDRQRKLVSKINSALARIEDGSYGYCEETGEPISLRRLEARPIATLSLEAQERHERRERVFRED
jgi:DnaK suppressor protein